MNNSGLVNINFDDFKNGDYKFDLNDLKMDQIADNMSKLAKKSSDYASNGAIELAKKVKGDASSKIFDMSLKATNSKDDAFNFSELKENMNEVIGDLLGDFAAVEYPGWHATALMIKRKYREEIDNQGVEQVMNQNIDYIIAFYCKEVVLNIIAAAFMEKFMELGVKSLKKATKSSSLGTATIFLQLGLLCIFEGPVIADQVREELSTRVDVEKFLEGNLTESLELSLPQDFLEKVHEQAVKRYDLKKKLSGYNKLFYPQEIKVDGEKLNFIIKNKIDGPGAWLGLWDGLKQIGHTIGNKIYDALDIDKQIRFFPLKVENNLEAIEEAVELYNEDITKFEGVEEVYGALDDTLNLYSVYKKKGLDIAFRGYINSKEVKDKIAEYSKMNKPSGNIDLGTEVLENCNYFYHTEKENKLVIYDSSLRTEKSVFEKDINLNNKQAQNQFEETIRKFREICSREKYPEFYRSPKSGVIKLSKYDINADLNNNWFLRRDNFIVRNYRVVFNSTDQIAQKKGVKKIELSRGRIKAEDKITQIKEFSIKNIMELNYDNLPEKGSAENKQELNDAANANLRQNDDQIGLKKLVIEPLFDKLDAKLRPNKQTPLPLGYRISTDGKFVVLYETEKIKDIKFPDVYQVNNNTLCGSGQLEEEISSSSDTVDFVMGMGQSGLCKEKDPQSGIKINEKKIGENILISDEYLAKLKQRPGSNYPTEIYEEVFEDKDFKVEYQFNINYNNPDNSYLLVGYGPTEKKNGEVQFSTEQLNQLKIENFVNGDYGIELSRYHRLKGSFDANIVDKGTRDLTGYEIYDYRHQEQSENGGDKIKVSSEGEEIILGQELEFKNELIKEDNIKEYEFSDKYGFYYLYSPEDGLVKINYGFGQDFANNKERLPMYGESIIIEDYKYGDFDLEFSISEAILYGSLKLVDSERSQRNALRKFLDHHQLSNNKYNYSYMYGSAGQIFDRDRKYRKYQMDIGTNKVFSKSNGQGKLAVQINAQKYQDLAQINWKIDQENKRDNYIALKADGVWAEFDKQNRELLVYYGEDNKFSNGLRILNFANKDYGIEIPGYEASQSDSDKKYKFVVKDDQAQAEVPVQKNSTGQGNILIKLFGEYQDLAEIDFEILPSKLQISREEGTDNYDIRVNYEGIVKKSPGIRGGTIECEYHENGAQNKYNLFINYGPDQAHQIQIKKFRTGDYGINLPLVRLDELSGGNCKINWAELHDKIIS
jgi:hypothetical protein